MSKRRITARDLMKAKQQLLKALQPQHGGVGVGLVNGTRGLVITISTLSVEDTERVVADLDLRVPVRVQCVPSIEAKD